MLYSYDPYDVQDDRRSDRKKLSAQNIILQTAILSNSENSPFDIIRSSNERRTII